MNSSGQEFSVFELLVQAIIGLVILTIIVSAITYFEGQKYAGSQELFRDKILAAANQPNGDIMMIKDIAFNSGSISSKSIELRTGVDFECVSFQAKESPYINASGGFGAESIVSFERAITLDVFIKCCPSESDECSQGIECVISFGERLEQGCSGVESH